MMVFAHSHSTTKLVIEAAVKHPIPAPKQSIKVVHEMAPDFWG